MNAEPALLAFDTSTEQPAVALLWRGRWSTANSAGGIAAGGIAAGGSAASGSAASSTLLPQVHSLLARAGAEMRALDAVAFGCGPGAFTGLRTSCAVAQGLAFGLGCGVLPIDSLLIVAEDARAQAGADAGSGFEVHVAMDARMEEAYAAHYRHGLTGWQVLAAPSLVALSSLAASANAMARAPGGEGTAGLSASGAAQWAPQGAATSASVWRAGSAWSVPSAECPAVMSRAVPELDRASALSRLALVAWLAGCARDPAHALPVYLRDRVALTTAERLAVKSKLGPGGAP